MKETKTKRTRRRFSDEFKRDCVELYRQHGITAKHVCEQFGVSPSSLARWVNQFDQVPAKGKPSYQELERELREMKDALRKKRVENDFLKKASDYFASQRCKGIER